MAELWMPGAVRDPQPGGVTLNASLPARATWHITWDKVIGGAQPPEANVSNYLKNQGYCPHLMWNPFTGDITQYYPANVGGRALNAWNEDGRVNIQIEVYFSPGVVHNGRSYQTVAETPAKGWDKILAWLDSHGIPRVWPMGAPQWQGNSRDVGTWNTQAGHYGHCNVPNNTHTDPGPMPPLGKPVSAQSSSINPEKEEPEMKYKRLYPKPIRRRLGKGSPWFLKAEGPDKKFTKNENYACLGAGLYDIDLFLQGDGLPTGETLTAQFFLVKDGKRSGYFSQDIPGSKDGSFAGTARFHMPVAGYTLEASVVSSAEGASLTVYGAEVTKATV